MEIDYSAICDMGKIRKENQDSVYAHTGEGWGIFVVADGMGGHAEGARASKTVTNMFKEWTKDDGLKLAECTTSHIFSEVRKIIEKANDRILNGSDEGELCGSTAVVLIITNENYVLLSVGDSRCYELKEKIWRYSLYRMTQDEIVNEPGSEYGKLTNAVGIRTPLRCNIISGSLRKKHIFFMCSDGVYKFCDEEELVSIIRRNKKKNLGVISREIKDLIYQHGAKDNLSAIVISVER